VDAAQQEDVPVLLGTLPVHLRYAGQGIAKGPASPAPALASDRCTVAAEVAYQEGRFDDAIASAKGCEDSPSAFLWVGLSLAALGRNDEAKAALEASVELLPRNRCRPSLNQMTREVAAAHDDVFLVDLEAIFAAAAPGGLPGAEAFYDYCHLNWRGYANATDHLLAGMARHGLGPKASPARLDFDVPAQAEAWALPPVDDVLPEGR